MRPRVYGGPLDPLFGETPRGRVSELASMIGVSRHTIQRWQKGETVSPYWRQQIDIICMARGIDPIFHRPDPPPRSHKTSPVKKQNGSRREREKRT